MKKSNKKRLESGVDFLSLPCDVISNICSFCRPKEVLAWSLTCQTLHKEIEKSMLHINVTRFNLSMEWKIPIFFPDQCHSVFFTFELSVSRKQHHTFVVVSRRRDNTSAETIVWEKTACFVPGVCAMFYVSFQNDPSQEYFVRHENLDVFYQISSLHASLRKQYMVNPLPPPIKDAFTACLKMGCIRSSIFKPMKNDFQARADILPFFMKLYVAGFSSLPHVESHAPIRAFFDSAFDVWCLGSCSRDLRNAQEEVSNFFEQVLEQKEPGHCVKLPMSPRVPLSDVRLGLQPHLLVHLTNEFVWNPSEHRNGLEFVARIPLFCSTRHFAVKIQSVSYTHRNEMFVLFFQKRQNSLEDSESPIVGKVVMDRQFLGADPTYFGVDQKYESCFLYFIPDHSTTTIKLNTLEVELVNVIFGNSDESFIKCDERADKVMQLLLEDYYIRLPLRDRLLPLALFRDVALTLLGSDQGPHAALKEALDANQIDTTPQGLQCIADICNVMVDE